MSEPVHNERTRESNPRADNSPSAQPPKALSASRKRLPSPEYLAYAVSIGNKWRAEAEAKDAERERESERARREAQIALLKAAPKPEGPLS